MESPEDWKPKNKSVIVWALDPFETATIPDQSMIRFISAWFTALFFEIQPVYVLPKTGSAPRKAIEIRAAEESGLRYLQEFAPQLVRPPEILHARSSLRKNEVLELLAFAELVDAPLIMVSSHGRKGLEKVFFGSFAENLLARSTKPLFFLTHSELGADEPLKPIHVLFATDFSEESLTAFKNFLHTTSVRKPKGLDMGLTIFNSISIPSLALSADCGLPLSDDFFAEQTKWACAEGSKLVAHAEMLGIQTKLRVTNGGIGTDTGAMILAAAAKERASLIVMASGRSSMTDTLLTMLTAIVSGNIAREVFRSNRYAVWIYGPYAIDNSAMLGTRNLQQLGFLEPKEH